MTISLSGGNPLSSLAALVVTVIAFGAPVAGTCAQATGARPAAPRPSLALNPSSYDPGGYSTIIWKGASPCVASASPAYEPWSGPKATDWAQSVAPQVTTVFTITCNGAATSVTLTVNGAESPSDASSRAPTAPAAGLPPTFNVAPSIAGAPPTRATVGLSYSFLPLARDANGDRLTFRAQNLPGWASLDPVSGAISGTPGAADVGLAANVVLSVTDGSFAVSLPAFGITVSAAGRSRPGEYAGYRYSLAAVRPFISLRDYESGGRNSSAYLRLRSQVDDAVEVTARMPAGATYDQIVQALNSGHYGYSSADSIILFHLTGEAKYINQAIRMVDAFVASENARIAAGETPRIAGDSYLEAGFYMEQVALAYDYGYSRLTAAQRATWSAFAEQAIWNIWNHASARWGRLSRPWTGWSVNDPGNNYFYSFLKATQLWALASQNSTWLSYLQAQKYPLLTQFFHSLTGGGSREGTGYGTALGSLFEDYSYWKASTGEDLAAYSSHATDTIDYWIHATVPTMDHFASIGDQSRSSKPLMFDYQRRLVAQAVALNLASPQARRGTWWLNRVKVTDGGGGWLTGRMRYNYNYRYDLLARSAAEEAPQGTLYDASGAGVLFARSDWGASASWLHVIAGPYDQSHAHQDQGSFSFFRNDWLSITANTSSNSGINQDVGVHNVIRFEANGAAIPQRNSVSSKTYTDDGNILSISETLTPAYAGSGGRVESWLRVLAYTRASHSILVRDNCRVAAGVTPVWQLQLPIAPVRQSDGSYVAGRLRIVPVVPVAPGVKVVDMRTVSREFNGGYRLEVTDPAGGCAFEVSLQAR